MTEEKRGRGRPPIDSELHRHAHSVHLADTEKETIDEAAKVKGWNFSKYMRSVALAYAKRINSN